MYDNDNLKSFDENTNKTIKEEPEEMNEWKAAEPSESTGFVLVNEPEGEEKAETAEAVEATVVPSTTDDSSANVQQTEETTQGVYSSTYEQQTYTSAPAGSGAQPYSARDIQPRKKTGWGKRIVILCLSGLLLGSCAAGAYLGITYLAGKSNQTVENHIQESQQEVIEKEPEISQVETVSPGQVTVGVAYDVSPVVENVMPAMVSIVNNYTETYSTFFGQTYTQQAASSGSGIIIGENETEIVIATNYHVISGSDEIVITFADGSSATAYIKGSNPDMDLAVVSVPLESLTAETKNSIAVASLGNSDELKLGQPVIAIGNALGYGQSVTTGVVSAIDREISMEDGVTGSYIQTDAAINPGNSGGALLNMSGQVIGINSSKIGGSTIEGMGYAIPISAAEPIISNLSLESTKIKVDAAEQGYLGIYIEEITASDSQRYGMPQGVYIRGLVEGGAAEQSDLHIRDIIVGFGSFEVSSQADLQEAMQYYAKGDTVSVEVMRVQNNEYQSVTVEITLGEKPKN